MVSDDRAESIRSEAATAALPAVIRHPDLILFKRSQRIAAEVCGLQCFDAVGWAAGRTSGL